MNSKVNHVKHCTQQHEEQRTSMSYHRGGASHVLGWYLPCVGVVPPMCWGGASHVCCRLEIGQAYLSASTSL